MDFPLFFNSPDDDTVPTLDDLLDEIRRYEEAEDISRIQEKLARSRRAKYERSREKEDFLVPSGKRGTH